MAFCLQPNFSKKIMGISFVVSLSLISDKSTHHSFCKSFSSIRLSNSFSFACNCLASNLQTHMTIWSYIDSYDHLVIYLPAYFLQWLISQYTNTLKPYRDIILEWRSSSSHWYSSLIQQQVFSSLVHSLPSALYNFITLSLLLIISPLEACWLASLALFPPFLTSLWG